MQPRDRDDVREQQVTPPPEPLAWSGDGRPTLPSPVSPAITRGGSAPLVWLPDEEPLGRGSARDQ